MAVREKLFTLHFYDEIHQGPNEKIGRVYRREEANLASDKVLEEKSLEMLYVDVPRVRYGRSVNPGNVKIGTRHGESV